MNNKKISLPRTPAAWLEAVMNFIFFLCGILAVGCVLLISVYMVISGVPAIQKIGLFRFLFGTRWASTAADPAYGILPFILSSVYGTLGATVIGVPIGLLTAVFLSKAAGPKVRTVVVTAIELLSGIPSVVIRATGSWYEVLHDGEAVRCRIRGRLRLKGIRSTNPVVVGDQVTCESDDGGDYVICDICPRRNYVIRRASNLSKESHIIAANIDQALLLATLRAPETATEFVDRFLVTCEAYKVPVTIALSKADLQDPSAMAEFRAVYEGAGYRVLEVSATEGVGVEAVCELLEGRVTLLSGNSGVGKSTLIHAIDPSLDIRTGEISDSHHKGRHTTTFSTMYPLAGGGAVIDTPGIKGFGLIDIDDAELWHYFPEMMRVAPECRFYNCTHTHEPGCAVVEAVREGKIAYARYESYLKILDEDEKYRK